MEDLTKILQDDDEFNEAELKKYLSGETPAEDLHAIEKKMADSEFINDAVEGLQSFSSAKKMDDYVVQLNKKLHQQLEVKKLRKEKRKISGMLWITIAVVLILLLCVLGFVIVKMQREKQQQNSSSVSQTFANPVYNTKNFIL